jgi:hypothetical protein
MEEKIKSLIESYVKDYSNKTDVLSKWKHPINKYASAKHLNFNKLKTSLDK